MNITEQNQEKLTVLEKIANGIMWWIGSIQSLIVHTLLFIIAFMLPVFQVVEFDKMLLVLTTILSLEAIYLAIFIQMSVNKSSEQIEEIQEDIEDIQEDIEEISEDIDEISEDIDEIQEDIEEINEEDEEELDEERYEKAKNVMLKSNVKHNKTEIKSLKDKIDELQNRLENLYNSDHSNS